MSMFSPRPRYRFYGTPQNYLTAARHAAAELTGGASQTDYVQMLEDRVADMAGTEHAICVPQARYGIYLALKYMIKPGQLVILSPYTIYDVVNMVICAGGRPLFCDIERETCNIGARSIEGALEEHGSDVGAVMVTHLHGLVCDMNAIRSICARFGVPVFEDAAQAFGARYGGAFAGGIGDVGVYSFGRAKNINGFYGGMIVTSNRALADSVRDELEPLEVVEAGVIAKRIAHCLVGDLMTLPVIFAPLTFRIFKLGAVNNVQSVNRLVQTEAEPVYRDSIPEKYERRISALQARVIYEQMFTVDEQTAERIGYARQYTEGLSDLEDVSLPPWRDDSSHIYLQYPIQVADRWDFVRAMMKRGRDVAIQHMGSAADLEIFREFAASCPVARRTADECVLLPTYPGYGADEVAANIETIRAYVTDRR